MPTFYIVVALVFGLFLFVATREGSPEKKLNGFDWFFVIGGAVLWPLILGMVIVESIWPTQDNQ